MKSTVESRRARLACFALGLAAALTACGQQLSGRFQDANGMIGLEFKGNGKVAMLEGGRATETRSYKVDGDRVLIDMGDRDMEFRLSKDGLAGPLGIQLRPAN